MAGRKAAVRFFSHVQNQWYDIGHAVPEGAAGDHVLEGYEAPDKDEEGTFSLPEASQEETPKRRGRVPRQRTDNGE